MLPAGDDDRLSGKAGRARLVALQHALMKLINDEADQPLDPNGDRVAAQLRQPL